MSHMLGWETGSSLKHFWSLVGPIAFLENGLYKQQKPQTVAVMLKLSYSLVLPWRQL